MNTLEQLRYMIYEKRESDIILLVESIQEESDRPVVEEYVRGHLPHLAPTPTCFWSAIESRLMETNIESLSDITVRYITEHYVFMQGVYSQNVELTWRMFVCQVVLFSNTTPRETRAYYANSYVKLLEKCKVLDDSVTILVTNAENVLGLSSNTDNKVAVTGKNRFWGYNSDRNTHALSWNEDNTPTTLETVFRVLLQLRVVVPERLFSLFEIDPVSVGYPALPQSAY